MYCVISSLRLRRCQSAGQPSLSEVAEVQARAQSVSGGLERVRSVLSGDGDGDGVDDDNVIVAIICVVVWREHLAKPVKTGHALLLYLE